MASTPVFQIGVPRRKLFMVFEFLSLLPPFHDLIEVDAFCRDIHRSVFIGVVFVSTLGADEDCL